MRSLLPLVCLALLVAPVCAQPDAPAKKAETSATSGTQWTTDQDHRNMMEQLGIKALRPPKNDKQGRS